jgi:hypothetical protein
MRAVLFPSLVSLSLILSVYAGRRDEAAIGDQALFWDRHFP